MISGNNHFTLITGASAGIGRALAVECAKRKMNLFLVALPGTGLPDVAENLRTEQGVRVEILENDLMRPDSASELFQAVKEKDVTVDILINNVGIGYHGLFQGMDQEKITRMILLNIHTSTLITRSFLPALVSLPQSHILNVCSMAAWAPLPGKSIYSASKAFVLYFSEALRQELRNTGVRITSVSPMGVPTNSVVRERIRHSGYIARKSVMEACDIARISVDGMLKGRRTIFPGVLNKIVFSMANLLPFFLVMKIAENEMLRFPAE